MMKDDPKPNFDRALVPETMKLLKLVKMALKNKVVIDKDISRRLGIQMMRTYRILEEIGTPDETR